MTVCRKAGRLTVGFDVSLDAVRSGTSRCLLVASNTSPKTVKELHYRISREGLEGKVKVLTMPLTIEDVAWYISYNAGVLAVCDDGFSRSFEKLLT